MLHKLFALIRSSKPEVKPSKRPADSPESLRFRKEMNDFFEAYFEMRPPITETISELEILSGPSVLDTEGVEV